MKKLTCQGKRRQNFEIKRCRRVAKWRITTMVGYSRTHYVCDDNDCYRSVTNGYHATAVPLA